MNGDNWMFFQGDNMKYAKPLLSSLIGVCVLLTGSQSLDSTFKSVVKPPQLIVTQTNETILNQFIVLNKGEISVSKLAMTRAHHRSVKHYAAHIHRDHVHALHAAMHLSKKSCIKPVMDTTSQN